MKVRSLSGRESRIVLSLEAGDQEVVTLDDIERLAHVSRTHARKLAHTLGQKGWLQRLGGGRYLLNPGRHGPDALADTDALRIGRRLVAPYYFAYATAANLHALLSQVSRLYTLATPARGGHRSVGPVDFRLVHLGRSRFFGSEDVTVRGVTVSVSDLEKTVVDCLDRPDLTGGVSACAQVVSRASRVVSYQRLYRYVARFQSPPLARRLGFLLSRTAPRRAVPAWFKDRLLELRSSAVVPLASPRLHGRSGPVDRVWNVVVNVPEAELFGEVGVR